MLKHLILIIVLISGAFGYFEERVVSPGKNAAFESSAPTVTVTKPDKTSIFPYEVQVKLRRIDGSEGVYTFERTRGVLNDRATMLDNVYVTDGASGVKRFEGVNVESQVYVSSDNTAATLMLYDHQYIIDAYENIVTSEAFAPLATIPEADGYTYQVVPSITTTKSISKSGNVVSKRTFGNTLKVKKADDEKKAAGDGVDYVYLNEEDRNKIEASYAPRQRRAVGGAPVQLYVEVLLVADLYIYQKYKLQLKTDDQKFIFTFMKIMYANLVLSTNRRYYNSFETDPDLKIGVRLTNYLFLTNINDCKWSDPTINGVPGNLTATLNGLPIISATPSLDELQNFLTAKSLPFNYDHAFGMTDARNIWLDGVWAVGVAPVGSVCSRRISLILDDGIYMARTLAHELGHNLGSTHDGTASNTFAANCLANDCYIMAPGITNFFPLNTFRFSNCSLLQFKNNLLDANGALKSTFTCLANVPVPTEFELGYFNTSLPGQIFNANDQCQMIYNSSSRADTCTNTNLCDTLVCSSAGFCYSIAGRGAADGTTCGTSKVCFNGLCVDLTSITVSASTPSPTPCTPNPCLNGGVCIQAARFYICNCTDTYYGQQCQLGGTTLVVSSSGTAASSTGATAGPSGATAGPTSATAGPSGATAGSTGATASGSTGAYSVQADKNNAKQSKLSFSICFVLPGLIYILTA